MTCILILLLRTELQKQGRKQPLASFIVSARWRFLPQAQLRVTVNLSHTYDLRARSDLYAGRMHQALWFHLLRIFS